MERHKAEWWQKRVNELERGATVEELARRHAVRAATLVWWRSELQRRNGANRDQRLLPVVLASEPATRSARAADAVEVVIEAVGMRVTVRGALDAASLTALMAVIRP